MSCWTRDGRLALARESKLPIAVIALGVVSLLTDISSDMIFPLLPAFLAARMGAAPVLLGAMEGIADLISSAFKLWSGRWADRAQRLRPMVVGGYALASIARPFMAFVNQWWQPILIRSLDRVGKGLRTSPRDAMIAGWVKEGERGKAFGFHRAMDNGGAALGSLAAALLVGLGIQVERIFLIAAIPGLVSLLGLAFVREPPIVRVPAVSLSLAPVPRRLFAYLGPVALFGLANSTDAFLLLKLTELKAPASLLPLAWLLLQGVKAMISYPAGRVADRIGSSKVVIAGWTLYAISYVGLAFAGSIPVALGVIGFYGLYHGFAEGAERALLADLAPAEVRGRAFGLYHAMSGVSSLLAGLLFGALWNWGSSRLAFLCAGSLALLSVVLLVALLPVAQRITTSPSAA